MDDGADLMRRVEVEITRRVGEVSVELRAQLEREWAERVGNADRGPERAAPAAPPPRPAALVARPERYDGRVHTLNDWLFRIKLFLRATGVAEDSPDAVDTVAGYLDKDAFSWWHHLSDRIDRGEETAITTWSGFSAAIRARFVVVDEDRNARIALTQLRQATTVRNYIQEFQRLSMLAPDTLERDQVVRFILGLRRDVREEVDRGHPTTILTAMKLADEAEGRLHGYRQDRPTLSPAWHNVRRNYNPGPTNMELGAVSAAARRGMQGRGMQGRGGRFQGRTGRPGNQQGPPHAGGPPNVKCWNCNKLGHLSRNCPEPRRQQQGNGPARA